MHLDLRLLLLLSLMTCLFLNVSCQRKLKQAGVKMKNDGSLKNGDGITDSEKEEVATNNASGLTEDGEADDDIEEKCQQLATKMSANFSLIEKNLTNQLKYVSGNLDLIKIKSNKQAIYIDKLKKKIAHLTGSGNQFFRANFSGVVQLQNNSTFKTTAVCEAREENNFDGKYTITCPSSSPIQQNVTIVKARYGRYSQDICSGPNDHLTCDRDVLEIIRKLCSGKPNCNLEVTNELMGGDPCGGIYKYLEVQYHC